MNRRTFLAAGAAAALKAQEKPVRIGMVGVGNRGTSLLRNFLDLPGVEIPAICDINEANLARAQGIVQKAGRPAAEGYARGPEDFRRLAERKDLDAVVNATPWEWHARIAVAAMRAGKYAAVEVPATLLLEECWELVETSEKTGMPCMLLENVCYFRNVLAVLNMIRQGLLGELLHAEAGYQHDVRGGKISPQGDLRWRGVEQTRHDGNLYPTHPIGPVAWWTDINRGDRFTHLVSMSTKARGLNEYAKKRLGADHPLAKRQFKQGDVNTTLIRTENGLTVTLYHDTNLPRPYDLILRIQGTGGIYSGTLEKIYIEGRSPKPHTWEDAAPYYEQYEHAIWKALGPTAKKYGHGGGDYIELHQFVKAVRSRTQTPIDVYDTATWSAITPLTEQSVAAKSAPVDFPDFTRGKWKQPRQLAIEA